jgi:MFS family permease
MDQSYRALLARGRSRLVLAALTAAWLSFGAVALAIFLATRRATGSDGSAGSAVAAFSLGAGLLAPARGRLLDRRGVRPWLPALAGGYAAALCALDLLAAAREPAWLLALAAGAAGVSAPPLVASLRAVWPAIAGPALVRRAYALTALLADAGSVVAPAAAGVLFVAVPQAPLPACAAAALVAAGIAARAGEPGRGRSAREEVGPLLSGALVRLLGVEVALGGALGLVEVAVPSAAAGWGEPGAAGVLLGSFAVGGVAGGLWFGRRNWREAPERRYLLAALALGAGLLPCAAATGPATLAPLLVLAGLASGPATISLFEALDALAPHRPTEALTLVTTAGAIGTAGGSLAAGWSTSNLGLWAPFACGAALLAGAAGIGLGLGPEKRKGPA